MALAPLTDGGDKEHRLSESRQVLAAIIGATRAESGPKLRPSDLPTDRPTCWHLSPSTSDTAEEALAKSSHGITVSAELKMKHPTPPGHKDLAA